MMRSGQSDSYHEHPGHGLRKWLSAIKSVFNRGEDAEPKTARQAAGEWGESVAARLLEAAGCKILGRRVRVGRNDELDIVARDGKILVFVEVKMRSGLEFGRPSTAVDKRKRPALSRAAVDYLRQLRFPKAYVRFDVVEVIGDYEDGEIAEVRHIKDAFRLDKRYRLPY